MDNRKKMQSILLLFSHEYRKTLSLKLQIKYQAFSLALAIVIALAAYFTGQLSGIYLWCYFMVFAVGVIKFCTMIYHNRNNHVIKASDPHKKIELYSELVFCTLATGGIIYKELFLVHLSGHISIFLVLLILSYAILCILADLKFLTISTL